MAHANTFQQIAKQKKALNGCYTKKAYLTANLALEAKAFALQKGKAYHADLNAYPCPTCHKWHLGHSHKTLH